MSAPPDSAEHGPPSGWAVRDRAASTIGGDGRILTGTAAALAGVLGVDPVVVRLGFVVLTVAGGLGILLYLAAWAAFTTVFPGARSVVRVPPGAEVDPLREVGFGLVVVGLVVQVRMWGWAFSDVLVWPVCALAAAVGLAWRRLGSVELAGLVEGQDGSSTSTLVRVLVGGVLAVGGGAALVGVDLSFVDWLRTMLGFVALLAGIGVMFGPTIRALSLALVAERRERIRADERAVISSHLHDSVLQTLTLIQKRADDPSEVQSLARRQERELRQWLYSDREARVGSVRSALEDSAAEVEDRHRIDVECVVVGDRPLDERSEAVVGAAAEALVNAAKFSGETRVSLYAEVTDTTLEVFVRDRGKGFDPTAVDEDRRGLAESIVGRVERVGGTAVVRSAPGQGAEVSLRLVTGPRQ